MKVELLLKVPFSYELCRVDVSPDTFEEHFRWNQNETKSGINVPTDFY